MRRLCSLASGKSRSYAERLPSLADHPMPSLHLPPGLHDKQSPPPPHMEGTTLPNGVRIASQDIPAQGPISCVGVAVGSGSIYETRWSAGVSHLLESLAFHDTKNRNLGKIA